MAEVAPFQRRWLMLFGLTLGMLVGAAVCLSLWLPNFREPAFNFYAMKPGELFNVYRLTRRQQGSVKLGFAEAYPAPAIGLYGNHIVAFFGADAFGRPEEAEFFFNYSYANLSLPEIHRYLLGVEEKGHLPTTLILIQITPPNADNGHFIINQGNELPPDILLTGIEGDVLSGQRPLITVAMAVWNLINNAAHEVLNYNTVILSLLQNGGYKERTINPSECRDEMPVSGPWLLTKVQEEFFVSSRLFCLRRYWGGALRRDGSQDATFQGGGPVIEDDKASSIAQNENPPKDADRGLRTGDEREIAGQLQAIDSVGTRHGIKVVFLVPPVYEPDRRDSVVNQIFDRALALVPGIAVIDDRHKHSDRSYFTDGIHPSPKYYRDVAEQIRRRGFIR